MDVGFRHVLPPRARQIPVLLCSPSTRAYYLGLKGTWKPKGRINALQISKAQFYSGTATPSPVAEAAAAAAGPLQYIELPSSCPGCGALTQSVSPDQPGYYSTGRKSVKAFIDSCEPYVNSALNHESNTFRHVLNNIKRSTLSQLGLQDLEGQQEGSHLDSFHNTQAPTTPVCNRCHDLVHHHLGVPVIHPTVKSIQDILAESPYKYNHIYHVLDATDFPLSLIPSLQQHLSLAPQRSLNRRANTGYFQHGKKAEMSFIITKSDLLAPRKEQVDGLMPYIIQVLRDSLGKSAENVRLGNVRCVSAKRGWWTKQVKEDIWKRGGGGWMVGKVNVGKSNLFENVFPKGRNDSTNFGTLRHRAYQSRNKEANKGSSPIPSVVPHTLMSDFSKEDIQPRSQLQSLDNAMLPPAPPENQYPVLPVVSSLPGTTASPIRVPFGGGKGELIDLPGLSRGDLEHFVLEARKPDLVMQRRIKPEQFTIKAGQSLLIGGLVRITPTTPDATFLAYPFVPLKCHVTSTEKATMAQTQKQGSSGISIARPGIGSRIEPAGSYSLRWDVTKQCAGPLTRKEAVGLKPDVLPFVIWSIDVLIEGSGWVELIAQTRKKDMESATQSGDLFDAKLYPEIEIFSPDGRHIGVRQPMGAAMLDRGKPKSSKQRTARPRRSMKGVKKRLKRDRGSTE